MTDIDFANREMLAVDLRVTGIQASFKKNSAMTRFSAVAVSPTTQCRIKKGEFYNVFCSEIGRAHV